MEATMPDADMALKVSNLTSMWLNQEVMNSFWRLTSLMGLDFFVSRNKHVAFVRQAGQADFQGERRAITDSEWQHANDQGYINNAQVTRHDPIN
jgi:hypothetical protein